MVPKASAPTYFPTLLFGAPAECSVKLALDRTTTVVAATIKPVDACTVIVIHCGYIVLNKIIIPIRLACYEPTRQSECTKSLCQPFRAHRTRPLRNTRYLRETNDAKIGSLACRTKGANFWQNCFFQHYEQRHVQHSCNVFDGLRN